MDRNQAEVALNTDALNGGDTLASVRNLLVFNDNGPGDHFCKSQSSVNNVVDKAGHR